jgi:hypothetical protein
MTRFIKVFSLAAIVLLAVLFLGASNSSAGGNCNKGNCPVTIVTEGDTTHHYYTPDVLLAGDSILVHCMNWTSGLHTDAGRGRINLQTGLVEVLRDPQIQATLKGCLDLFDEPMPDNLPAPLPVEEKRSRPNK